MSRALLILVGLAMLLVACTQPSSEPDPQPGFEIVLRTAVAEVIADRGQLAVSVATVRASGVTPTAPVISTPNPTPTRIPTPTPVVVHTTTPTLVATPTAIPTPTATAIPTLAPSPTPTSSPTPTLGEIAEALSTSVLRIETEHGVGSGVVIDRQEDGTISVLTNSHVIDFAESIEVTGESIEPYTATIVGQDIARDLAVIRFCCNTDSEPATLSDTPPPGAIVHAIGYPGGAESIVITSGIVSGTQQNSFRGRLEIQTDAEIRPGNSGGPLMLDDGTVAGLATFAITRTGGILADSLGFAVGSETIQEFLPSLMQGVTPPIPVAEYPSTFTGNVYQNPRSDYRVTIQPGWWVSSSNGDKDVLITTYRSDVFVSIRQLPYPLSELAPWELVVGQLSFGEDIEWDSFELVSQIATTRETWAEPGSRPTRPIGGKAITYTFEEGGQKYRGETIWFYSRQIAISTRTPLNEFGSTDFSEDSAKANTIMLSTTFKGWY